MQLRSSSDGCDIVAESPTLARKSPTLFGRYKEAFYWESDVQLVPCGDAVNRDNLSGDKWCLLGRRGDLMNNFVVWGPSGAVFWSGGFD